MKGTSTFSKFTNEIYVMKIANFLWIRTFKILCILMAKLSWQSSRIEYTHWEQIFLSWIDFCMHVYEYDFLSWHKHFNNFQLESVLNCKKCSHSFFLLALSSKWTDVTFLQEPECSVLLHIVAMVSHYHYCWPHSAQLTMGLVYFWNCIF